jgi:hypothetical protein
VPGFLQQDFLASHTGFCQQVSHDGGFGGAVPADRSGWYEADIAVVFGTCEGGFDAPPKGCTRLSVWAHRGAKDQDCHHLAILCQISHRKQSGRRYNADVLCGAALGVELVQGIGLNPRGTHMRFVSTRWSLSAAGLISALALAACSSPPPPPPPPAPAPVVMPAPMPPPAVHHRWKKHSKAWYRKHKRVKHRKM